MPKKDPVKIVRWYNYISESTMHVFRNPPRISWFLLHSDYQYVYYYWVSFCCLACVCLISCCHHCSHEHIEILTVNGELLFFRQREGPFFPTLRLLHKCKVCPHDWSWALDFFLFYCFIWRIKISVARFMWVVSVVFLMTTQVWPFQNAMNKCRNTYFAEVILINYFLFSDTSVTVHLCTIYFWHFISKDLIPVWALSGFSSHFRYPPTFLANK